MEYELPGPPTPGRAPVLLVADCSLPADEFSRLVETLSKLVALLPPDTPVGLITFGEAVEIHELNPDISATSLAPRIWHLSSQLAEREAALVHEVLGFQLAHEEAAPNPTSQQPAFYQQWQQESGKPTPHPVGRRRFYQHLGDTPPTGATASASGGRGRRSGRSDMDDAAAIDPAAARRRFFVPASEFDVAAALDARQAACAFLPPPTPSTTTADLVATGEPPNSGAGFRGKLAEAVAAAAAEAARTDCYRGRRPPRCTDNDFKRIIW